MMKLELLFTDMKKKKKNLIFTLELSQKSDFELSIIKSDNIGHPTIKTG